MVNKDREVDTGREHWIGARTAMTVSTESINPNLELGIVAYDIGRGYIGY